MLLLCITYVTNEIDNVSHDCCHTWAGAPSCSLELLDKLQKWICRTAGHSFDVSLKPLAHRQNVANSFLKVLLCRPVIKENTTHVVAAHQSNDLLL